MPTIDLGKTVGPQGPQGMQGARGPQDATSTQGPKGEQGIQGPQGETGAKSAVDTIGAQGPASADGSTLNIQVGMTATLAVGSAAMVERQTESPGAAPIFDLGILRGTDAVNPGNMTRTVRDPRGKTQGIFAYAGRKMSKTGGAFIGGTSGVSPTSGSTKSFRNICFGSDAPVSSLRASGDIYINIG